MLDRRTSLIFDPADGKIPPLTPAAQARAAARAEAASRRGPADAAEYRSLGERCISWGNDGPPMLGATYGNNLHILQTGTNVVIRHELMRAIRVIPLDGQAARRRQPPHAERRPARPLGRRHAGGRHDQLHRPDPVQGTAGDDARRTSSPASRCTWSSASRAWTPTRSATGSPSKTPGPGSGPGRRSSSCEGGRARSSSTRAVKATTGSRSS